jgi:predicted membrane-bound mannosyltransferase
MNRAILLLLLLIAFGALAFRCHRLNVRPFHADESVQAAIFRTLWEDGTYTYNPHEFHGPTLPASTWPAVKLSGKNKFAEPTRRLFGSCPCFSAAP